MDKQFKKTPKFQINHTLYIRINTNISPFQLKETSLKDIQQSIPYQLL